MWSYFSGNRRHCCWILCGVDLEWIILRNSVVTWMKEAVHSTEPIMSDAFSVTSVYFCSIWPLHLHRYFLFQKLFYACRRVSFLLICGSVSPATCEDCCVDYALAYYLRSTRFERLWWSMFVFWTFFAMTCSATRGVVSGCVTAAGTDLARPCSGENAVCPVALQLQGAAQRSIRTRLTAPPPTEFSFPFHSVRNVSSQTEGMRWGT